MIRSAGKPILHYGWPVNWQSPLNRGLVAWWLKLPQRGGGNRYLDLCNRYHGTLQGATWGGNRTYGWGCLKFVRASSQYVSLASTVTAAPITLTGWFYSDDTTNSQEILSCTNTGGTGEGFRLNANGAARTIRAITTSGGTSRISTTSNLWTASTWNFGAATFASATSRIAYLNGVSATEETTSTTPSGVNGTAIGRLEFASVINYFSGFLDDLRVYNRALSGSEILQLYNAGRARYPRELNWIRRPLINATAAAATQSWVVGGGVGGPSSVI